MEIEIQFRNGVKWVVRGEKAQIDDWTIQNIERLSGTQQVKNLG